MSSESVPTRKGIHQGRSGAPQRLSSQIDGEPNWQIIWRGIEPLIFSLGSYQGAPHENRET